MRRRVVMAGGAAAVVAALAPGARPASARVPATTTRSGSGMAGPTLSLPDPTGPRRVGTVALHLVDVSRRDPWVPAHPFRELMVQIW